jgi:hypothetical protein
MRWLIVASVAVFQAPAQAPALQSEGLSLQPVLVVAPQYPSQFREARIQMKVRVAVKVDARGVPIQAEPSLLLEPMRTSFERTAMKWRFQPAVDPGSRPRGVELTFAFRIADWDAQQEDLGPFFSPPHLVEVVTVLPRLKPISLAVDGRPTSG